MKVQPRMVLILVLVFVWTPKIFAKSKKEIKYDPSQFATETVLPSLDNMTAVLGRAINFTDRVELSLMFNYNMSEAIYNPMGASGHLSYHFNNIHSLGVEIGYHLDGLSPGGINLRDDVIIVSGGGGASTGNTGFDGGLTDQKNYSFNLRYEFDAYYGKISLAKDAVMNMSLFGILGAGAYMMGSEMFPMATLGFGQKMFISKNVAIRIDLVARLYNGPDITSGEDDITTNLTTGNTRADIKDFDTALQTDLSVLTGLSFIF